VKNIFENIFKEKWGTLNWPWKRRDRDKLWTDNPQSQPSTLCNP